MTKSNGRDAVIKIKELFGAHDELIREGLQGWLQQILESEMTEALGAARGERTDGRIGYRSGHCSRSLVTRVGALELRVPQDRDGYFSTEVFERYQRSEKALVAALSQMQSRACRRGRCGRLPRRCAGTTSRPRRSRTW